MEKPKESHSGRETGEPVGHIFLQCFPTSLYIRGLIIDDMSCRPLRAEEKQVAPMTLSQQGPSRRSRHLAPSLAPSTLRAQGEQLQDNLSQAAPRVRCMCKCLCATPWRKPSQRCTRPLYSLHAKIRRAPALPYPCGSQSTKGSRLIIETPHGSSYSRCTN